MSRFWQLVADFLPNHPFVNVPVAMNLDACSTQVQIGSELVFNEPTCLSWHKTSQQVLNFGRTAYNLIGKTPNQVEVVFPLADGRVVKTKWLELFLKSVLSKVKTKDVGQIDLRMGVTSGLPLSHSAALRQICGRIPGISTVQLIPRMEAAYQALVRLKKVGSQAGIILFSDSGVEVGIFAGGKLVVTNQAEIGKNRFINLVREQVRLKHQLEIGDETAAQIWQEIALVNLDETDDQINSQRKNLQMVIRGKNILTHLPITTQVSSSDLNDGMKLVLAELLIAVKRTFDQISPELLGGLLENGLVITGPIGLRGLDNYLLDKLHCPVVFSATAQSDVIKGLMLTSQSSQ